MRTLVLLAFFFLFAGISQCSSENVIKIIPESDDSDVEELSPSGWRIFDSIPILYRLSQFAVSSFEQFYNALTKEDDISAHVIEEISFGDGYCGCGLDDEFGLPDDWESMNIWLDIVIILDTSEAMGEIALTDASILIDLLIGDDYVDILNTNSTDEFYTRVGLILMSDKAEVLYNLNMTKADKILGRVNIAAGVSEINTVAAFDAALAMFQDGLRRSPDRANTRQVIYYMTNSDPANDYYQSALKNWQGVIIVNQLIDDEKEHPGLKELAAVGYYHMNSDGNYLDTIQLFCKANCFCGSGKVAYSGRDPNPAVPAAGGCFQAAPISLSFNDARSHCDKTGGGRIASVHNEETAIFVQKQLEVVAPESSKFWIGYSQVNDGSWKWEDRSSNPTTNWANNQPDPNAVSNCAYVHATTPELFWGAGECDINLPSICEFAPCSVGNKNC